MDFETRKIRTKPSLKDRLSSKISSATANKKININLPILIAITIILVLCVGIVKAVSKVDVSLVLKIAGTDLEEDSYGHTNFLLLGSGGLNHDGGTLTDTMIVASLDDENKTVTMLSIPRDLWIKDSVVGNSKINEVYLNAKTYYEEINKVPAKTEDPKSNQQAMELLKTKIEELLGIPIHYYVSANFDAFTDIVDAIGGVDINVEKAIYDPLYPKAGTVEYETFSMPKGLQHLDGKTALKYARSRETTSDFDRSERQQQLIMAIKESALKANILFSKEKIENILGIIKSNLNTNITIEEILTLGSIAKNYSKDSIVTRLMHDDPTKCGGFLYTPERSYYGGAFVLVPAGGFEVIHKYADLIFGFTAISKEDAKIQILNGTPRGGVAGETKQILQRFCLNMSRFGNAETKNVTQTTYYYKTKLNEKGEPIESRSLTLDFLKKLIPGKEVEGIPQKYIDLGYTDSDIILEMGADYTSSPNYMEDPFYSLPMLKPATPTPAETTTETTTTTPTNEIK
ncbi:LCP family protein [Candidatus Gracilibacteria bacterium]|nr:LCP family protein [Candidatus Gracilibacteria bacterium]